MDSLDLINWGYWPFVLMAIVVALVVVIYNLSKQLLAIRPIVHQRLYMWAWKTDAPGEQDKNEKYLKGFVLPVTKYLRKVLPKHLQHEDKIVMIKHQWNDDNDRNMVYVGKDKQYLDWFLNHVIDHELRIQEKRIRAEYEEH